MSIKIYDPVCEYKKNPFGIENKNPRLSWKLETDIKNTVQTAYRIQAVMDENNFSSQNLCWDTDIVKSDQSIHVKYEGEDLKAKKRYYWRVKVWDNHSNESDWSTPQFFEMGMLEKKDWKAKWIVPGFDQKGASEQPCPILRKKFKTQYKVKSARLYITARGLYEANINGNKVGDQLFTPGFTSYDKRLQYQVYDITSSINEGDNAVAVILGEGWYSGVFGNDVEKNNYGDENVLLAQIEILYKNGQKELIISDDTWKSSTGPILKSTIYNGEIYDANLEIPGFDLPGFNDSQWSDTVIKDYTFDTLCSSDGVPVTKIEEIKPVKIIKTPNGETVVDMGQNMVGWVRINANRNKGDRIVVQHFEILDTEGNVYLENLRQAAQTDKYILNGKGKETFEPHFTFHGFRYVHIIEYPGSLDINNITGIVIHSDMKKTGLFECSNPLINKLQQNILWGQKGNFLDIPTDCPQRNERLGWTGDAQVFIRTACFNMNVAAFFTKWLKDLAADQVENGGVPHVIPEIWRRSEMGHSSSAWGDAAVICPWTIYLCYGDTDILKNQYDSMKAWVNYIEAKSENNIWNSGFHFGDWLSLDLPPGSNTSFGSTSTDIVATAYYGYSAFLLAKTAKVLGYAEDEKKYTELFETITKAFCDEFISSNGRIGSNTQTSYVLPIFFKFLPKELWKKAAKRLVKDIKERENHISTGFAATPHIAHALSITGNTDVAYALLEQEDYPSWLYPVKKGATTIWERWDGIKPDGTLQSKGMNSFNHYAYGSIGSWMYQVAAGIETDDEKAGYKHIIIQPQPGGSLTFVKAQLETMYGKVKSAWEIKDETFALNVEIPPNTTAVIKLPQKECKDIHVGSGSYSFECRL